MPSCLIGNPPNSGFQQLVSGFPWSGRGAFGPTAGVQIGWSPDASGYAYVAFSGGHPNSGGPTINSGGMFLSGGGLMDGFRLSPGATYFVPKLLLLSGNVNIYIGCDAAASGQGRMYWDSL